jgi:hypothetical protein
VKCNFSVLCDRVLYTERVCGENYLKIINKNSLGKLCEWLREQRLRKYHLKLKTVRLPKTWTNVQKREYGDLERRLV